MSEAVDAILLDANLLLLAVVGSFDRTLIGRKRLDVYSSGDFDLLAELISGYPRNLTTPHLLAEVNNLADQCVPKRCHRDFREFFRAWVAYLDEHWNRANELCAMEEFAALGLSDSAIVQLSDNRTTVLSVDMELCNVLWTKGIEAENFNHLRDR